MHTQGNWLRKLATDSRWGLILPNEANSHQQVWWYQQQFLGLMWSKVSFKKCDGKMISLAMRFIFEAWRNANGTEIRRTYKPILWLLGLAADCAADNLAVKTISICCTDQRFCLLTARILQKQDVTGKNRNCQQLSQTFFPRNFQKNTNRPERLFNICHYHRILARSSQNSQGHTYKLTWTYEYIHISKRAM